ncbi:MAG TPA: hypothetical protein VEX18_20860 [Polyangiaceae bacterium]|nr:hypothetical protein [Polyangiaceae bacterium]
MWVGLGPLGVLTITLALACGGRSTDRSDTLLPDSPDPNPTGRGGAGTAGGANPQEPTAPPLAGAGGEAPGAGGEAAGAGAGPIDACAGVAMLCTPGEPLCDPALGVTAICDECGVARPDGEATLCARLIASDKESSTVCVVRGATELECWPTWSGIQSGVVPPETREVLLRDDSAAQENEYGRPCMRTGVTTYSCFGSADCSRVTVGDDSVCAICDGQLVCKGNVTLPEFHIDPPIDITITDSALFSLGAAGVSAYTWGPILPDFWRGSPRDLRVDHFMGGCIVSTSNELACWESLSQPPLLPSAWTGFRKFVPMSLPQACMLDTHGRVGCGDVFVGVAPPLFDVANVVDLVASSSLACALTREGRVHCWDYQGAALELPPDW